MWRSMLLIILLIVGCSNNPTNPEVKQETNQVEISEGILGESENDYFQIDESRRVKYWKIATPDIIIISIYVKSDMGMYYSAYWDWYDEENIMIFKTGTIHEATEYYIVFCIRTEK